MIQKFKLFLLTFVHFLTDCYSSLLSPLLPVLIIKLDLSLTMAGALGAVALLTSSLFQPMMGILGDRMKKRYFIIVGPLFAAIFMSSVGLAPNFNILVVLVLLGGFGTASFHPQSVSMAGDVSGKRRGLGVSLFIGGGTLGLAVSPLVSTWYVDRFGIESLIWLAVPTVFAVILMARSLPITNPSPRIVTVAQLFEQFRPHLSAMIILTVVVIIRTLAGIGFTMFLPVLMAERGYSLLSGGAILTMFSSAGVLGGLLGGVISDRIGRARVIWITVLLTTPFLYGFLHTEGWLMYCMLFAGGFMVLASNSVAIAMAQELFPENAGTASSFPMGFSWGVAGGMMVLVGNSADRIGVESTLEILAFVPILGALLALKLPKDHRRLVSASVGQPESPELIGNAGDSEAASKS
ncbi:MAG: MFS transporter [Candidatus Latescibacteria bacterium]|nr:MFS transporter [Candidatus Latescibacterota bacterium]